MKTPEEIKKGLECGFCHECPYDDNKQETVEECARQVHKDAIACIQQLESTVSQVSKALCGNENATTEELLKAVDQLKTSLAQVERERDAAVADLENSAPCFACYHFMRNKGMCRGGMRCCDEQFRASIGLTEYDGPEWQWRGVCPENTKGDANGT